MRNLLEQADATRQTASVLRRHANHGDELEVHELIVTLKLAERLEVHAAEPEYRWLTIGVPSKPCEPNLNRLRLRQVEYWH